jgi:hypothetical protein
MTARIVDGIICFGKEKIRIEVKSGDAQYLGTLQHAKDIELIKEGVFTRVVAVKLKTYAEYFGK